MSGQEFKSRCEYSLIREKLEGLWQKYGKEKLSFSTAYGEAGELLELDALCGEAMFFRFYALRILRKPDKASEFFQHEARPEAVLLRQVVEDCVQEQGEGSGLGGEALHYYLWNREKVLALMGQEFHQYLRDFYFSWLKQERGGQEVLPGETDGLFRAIAGKARVFESIYGEGRYSSLYMALGSIQDSLDKLEKLFPFQADYRLFVETRCLQYLEPYLKYLAEAEGALSEEDSCRLCAAFARINEVLAGTARELEGQREEMRLIEFSVIERELERALKENELLRQFHNR